jgi:hypothetical protein
MTKNDKRWHFFPLSSPSGHHFPHPLLPPAPSFWGGGGGGGSKKWYVIIYTNHPRGVGETVTDIPCPIIRSFFLTFIFPVYKQGSVFTCTIADLLKKIALSTIPEDFKGIVYFEKVHYFQPWLNSMRKKPSRADVHS